MFFVSSREQKSKQPDSATKPSCFSHKKNSSEGINKDTPPLFFGVEAPEFFLLKKSLRKKMR